MKQLFVATVFLFSFPTIGCTLGYVDYEPVFSNGRSDLSASEVLRLANWRAQLRLWLPSGGKYLVYVRQNARVGVSAKLAEQRRKNLLSTLSNMGIDKVDIEESAVRRFRDGLRPGQELRHLTNVAEISIIPRCPHPCCPGPQPIDAQQGDRGDHDQSKLAGIGEFVSAVDRSRHAGDVPVE